MAEARRAEHACPRENSMITAHAGNGRHWRSAENKPKSAHPRGAAGKMTRSKNFHKELRLAQKAAPCKHCLPRKNGAAAPAGLPLPACGQAAIDGIATAGREFTADVRIQRQGTGGIHQ